MGLLNGILHMPAEIAAGMRRELVLTQWLYWLSLASSSPSP